MCCCNAHWFAGLMRAAQAKRNSKLLKLVQAIVRASYDAHVLSIGKP